MAKYSVEELVVFISATGFLGSKKCKEVTDIYNSIIAKLRAGEKLAEAAIKVMGDLGLNDDPAFAGLGKAVDEYEEA